MAKSITPEQLAKSGSEDANQMALFCWAALSGIPELKWLFHIPNGGFRNPREAAKFKAMGVKSGVPDIFLAYPYALSHGLWIELKVGKNKITDRQSEWHQYLTNVGYWVSVCYGWEDARDTILEYLGRKI